MALQKFEFTQVFVIKLLVSIEETLAALSRRIAFTYEVGDRLGEVLEEFLRSPYGQSFEWKSSDLTNTFGQVQGNIRTRPTPKQTEKSSVLLNLKPSGAVTVAMADWRLNDVGDWEEDAESVEVKIDTEKPTEEVTAKILSAIIASSSTFGLSLRAFVENTLSASPYPSFRPEPN